VIVLDSSAVLETLLRTEGAEPVDRKMFAPGETLHAPHLLDLEIAQVVRRYVAGRAFDAERGRLALADFADLPLTRYPHTMLLARVWSLRNNLTAYDAVYVALAEALGAPLLTRDRRLASATGHHAAVELL
jgi:predicted nucleic acid-binding protein